MYRVTNAIEGVTQVYPTIIKDSLFMIKIFFANTLLLWFTLWAVKFSFLALYRKLFSGIKVYMHLWWGVVVFALIVSVPDDWVAHSIKLTATYPGPHRLRDLEFHVLL